MGRPEAAPDPADGELSTNALVTETFALNLCGSPYETSQPATRLVHEVPHVNNPDHTDLQVMVLNDLNGASPGWADPGGQIYVQFSLRHPTPIPEPSALVIFLAIDASWLLSRPRGFRPRERALNGV